jgi:endonuclease/exonuclease/phosphatase (EEP) superfamily protein YafD
VPKLSRLPRIFAGTVSIAVLGVTLLGFQGEWFRFFDLLSHFRVYLAAFSLLVVIAAVVVENRLAIYLSVISLAVNALTIAPYISWPQAYSDDRHFRLATVNLWVNNPATAPAIEFLRNSDADVVVLNEMTPLWKLAAKTLEDIYPYQYFRMNCQEPGHCQMALLSKEPWEELLSATNTPDTPSFIMARFSRQKWGITILGTRLIWPLGDGTAELQERQINAISKIVNKEGGAIILTGDFNFSPWSILHRKLTGATGLKRAEGGILASWISRSLPIRLPIDHTFVRLPAGTARMHLGPNIGSDHLPIITDLILNEI